MNRGPIIAIDGPAGAGKSTVARHVAQHFGLLYLETGAMYRAFALKAIVSDQDFEDAASLERLARSTQITLEADRASNRVYLDGQDVTERIRDADVTQSASRVSVHPGIRKWMVDLQRELGRKGGVVMEGRDIGSVVFPHADLKVFLDASPEVRAGRRQRELEEKGEPLEFEKVLEEVRIRDRRDREREMSPLVRAADAVMVDNTAMDAEETARAIVLLAREKARAAAG